MMPSLLRILDANANRAREALRVMEESARFVLDSPGLTRSLKQLRHDLVAALSKLQGLEFSRNTPDDVGTAIGNPSEGTRESIHAVVVASAKRLGEALRVIEEYSKVPPVSQTGIGPKIEQLRYRAYDLEQKLLAQLASKRVCQWRLCIIITESICLHLPWTDVVKACLDGGADCLQLREKNLDDGDLLHRAATMVDLAQPQTKKTRAGKKTGVSVIINDRPDIALLAGADGVHLGRDDLPCQQVRQLIDRQLTTGEPNRLPLIIGVSTHSLTEARLAIAAGADYCGVGAMFDTTTKPRKTSGPEYLAKFRKRYPNENHLAIGGITVDKVLRVIEAGARGVAVSQAVCAAKKPATVVRQLLKRIPKLR